MQIQRLGLAVCVALAGACSGRLRTQDAGGGELGGGGPGGSGSSGGATGGTAMGGGTGGGPGILTVDAGAATTLAMGAPALIAVDATHVYWTDPPAKTVMKVPKAGGAATTLASNQDLGSGLAVDTTNVYWTIMQGATGSVVKAPIDGGTPTVIASQERRLRGVAVAADSVYWGNLGDALGMNGAIMKVSLATGAVGAFTTTHGAAALAGTDGTFIYWSESGEGADQVHWMPLAGGDDQWSVVLGLQGIAFGGGNVYWGERSSGPARVMKRALEGGQDATLFSSSSHGFSNLLADGPNLYAADGHSILRIAVDGSAVAAIPTEGTPVRFVIDEARLYFTTVEGAIMVMAKP